jgi:uncharacterized coiled-coil protein SlyX
VLRPSRLAGYSGERKAMHQDNSAQRIKDLERQLAEKDRIIADLVKRHLESREYQLEQRVSTLEHALRKWMTAALKGKLQMTGVARKKK